MAMEMVQTHDVQPLEGLSVLTRDPGERSEHHGSFELFHQELAQRPLLQK